jgi:probable rRNA maturation factor
MPITAASQPKRATGRLAKRRPPAQRPPARLTVAVRNRQRTRRVDLRLLRSMTRWLLTRQFQAEESELCVHLVGTEEITRLNWEFLRHEGSTDVISFDHHELKAQSSPGGPEEAGQVASRREFAKAGALKHPGSFYGEIFISVDEAVVQARRFGTTWESELARYVIHGLLHLVGYDDLEPQARRRMKREEGRLLRSVVAQFSLRQLARSNH